MGATFQKRLTAVMRRGNLTVSDLARWFRRPVPTVRCWTHRGFVPRQDLGAILDPLERLVRNRNGFPVPLMTRLERIRYLAGVRRKIGKPPS